MKILNQKGIAPIIIILAAVALSSAIFVASKKSFQVATIQKSATIEPQVVVTPTPMATATATPSATPTATPASGPATPKATTKPTPTPTPQPAVNNTPPGAGYSRQTVSAEGVNYNVDIIAADLNSTKVIVDTASDSDCSNECPALSVAQYASRSGAYAGINGSYFCPPDYPSCAGKTNSFDTLVMNKNKVYFNSSNNVYSTIPAAIFYAGGARFVGQTLEWGRDNTSVDAVIANYPLLIAGGNINFTEAPNEPKFGGKAIRTFIATKGNMVYIGLVRNASMGESAKVLKAMGMDSALNLDQGGSTALWSGGRYIAGPGRNVPNAILFVNR